jgi:hypothetical protein
MRQYLSELRINIEGLQSDRIFCEGLAYAYLKSAELAENHERRQTHTAISASCFRRAAAHAILLDEHESSKKLFAQAGRAYTRLGIPYGLMMHSLSNIRLPESPDIAGTLFESFQSRRARDSYWLARQGAYLLLFLATDQRSNERINGMIKEMSPELQASRSTPIGILGLPVGAYINLSTALRRSDVPEVEEALLPFLSTYNTAVTQASADIHHWRRMAIPFHAAEPDIMSVLVIANIVLETKQRSIFDLFKKLPLARQTQTILNGALEQILHPDIEREL